MSIDLWGPDRGLVLIEMCDNSRRAKRLYGLSGDLLRDWMEGQEESVVQRLARVENPQDRSVLVALLIHSFTAMGEEPWVVEFILRTIGEYNG